MTRFRTTAGVCVLAGLLGAGIVVAVMAAPAPVGRAGDQFEFGELHYRYRGATAVIPPGGGVIRTPAKTLIRWITAKATMEADGWEDMASQLKAPAAVKGATDDNHRLRVLDQLNSLGWDFVPALKMAPEQPRRDSAHVEIWTFKRKVK